MDVETIEELHDRLRSAIAETLADLEIRAEGPTGQTRVLDPTVRIYCEAAAEIIYGDHVEPLVVQRDAAVERAEAAERQRDEAESYLPESFYADIVFEERVRMMTRIWNSAVKAASELEAERDVAASMARELADALRCFLPSSISPTPNLVELHITRATFDASVAALEAFDAAGSPEPNPFDELGPLDYDPEVMIGAMQDAEDAADEARGSPEPKEGT